MIEELLLTKEGGVLLYEGLKLIAESLGSISTSIIVAALIRAFFNK